MPFILTPSKCTVKIPGKNICYVVEMLINRYIYMHKILENVMYYVEMYT